MSNYVDMSDFLFYKVDFANQKCVSFANTISRRIHVAHQVRII